MSDETTLQIILDSMKGFSGKLEHLSGEVGELKTGVEVLKVRTKHLDKMVTKDSATTLIAYAIGEHEKKCFALHGNEDKGLTNAKTKLLLAVAGLLISVTAYFAGGLV